MNGGTVQREVWIAESEFQRGTSFLRGRVAVITGADSELGYHIILRLLKYRMLVIAFVNSDNSTLLEVENGPYKGKFFIKKMKYTEEEIDEAFVWVHRQIGDLYLLINNISTIPRWCNIEDDNIDELALERLPAWMANWKHMATQNLICMAQATREAVKEMSKHFDKGVIINMNCLYPNDSSFTSCFYEGLRASISAFTESVRLELYKGKTEILIACVNVTPEKVGLGECTFSEVQINDVLSSMELILVGRVNYEITTKAIVKE